MRSSRRGSASSSAGPGSSTNAYRSSPRTSAGGVRIVDSVDLMGGAKLIVDEIDERCAETLQRVAAALSVQDSASQPHHPTIGRLRRRGRRSRRDCGRVDRDVHQVGDEPQPDTERARRAR